METCNSTASTSSTKMSENPYMSYLKAKTKEKPPGCRSKWSVTSTSERLIWLIVTPIRALLSISNVTLFFFAYFGFLMPILWAKPLWPRFFWFYEGKLHMWLQSFIGYWGYTADYDIYEYGDDITQLCADERILLICNHQGTSDVPTLFSVLQTKGVTIWLMDAMFRWTPFGIIGNIHGDHFIKQGKATRDKELERLREHLREIFWDRDRRLIVLFPEGGFYSKRVESSQRYAQKNGFPHLIHTTLPRMGAVQAILEEVGPRFERTNSSFISLKSSSSSKLQLLKDTVDTIREKKYIKETKPPINYVLDVTIAYENSFPMSMFTLSLGTREKCNIAVNYKIYNASEVPFRDEDALRDWMYDVYEIFIAIDNYYRFGTFHPGEKGDRLAFAWSKIIGMYSFWFIGLFLQLKFYYWLINRIFDSLIRL